MLELLPVTLLKNSFTGVFQGLIIDFRTPILQNASQWLLLNLQISHFFYKIGTVLKSYVGITNEPAQNICAPVSILLTLYTFHNFSSFFTILYWQITLLQSSLTINLNSFYVKIGERITKTWKLLPFSRQLSSLKLFFQEKLWIKGFICCTNVKIKF